MRNDLAGWLAPNRLYPGVADALRGAMGDPGADVSIVTTKQARFTHTLLRDLAGVDMPMERIYSQVRRGAQMGALAAAICHAMRLAHMQALHPHPSTHTDGQRPPQDGGPGPPGGTGGARDAPGVCGGQAEHTGSGGQDTRL